MCSGGPAGERLLLLLLQQQQQREQLQQEARGRLQGLLVGLETPLEAGTLGIDGPQGDNPLLPSGPSLLLRSSVGWPALHCLRKQQMLQAG